MPTRILFGEGKSKEIGAICAEAGYKKVFVVTDSNIGKTAMLTDLCEHIRSAGLECSVCDKAATDPTIELVDETTAEAKRCDADAVIALGGGSPIDLGKAVAVLQTNEGSVRDYLFGGTKSVSRPGKPFIAIPTTAGTGSEMTSSAVVTDLQNNIKLSVTHDLLLPKTAVIDPLLHVGMPPLVTAFTGVDALTHAIESYTSRNAAPFSDTLGIAAIKMIGENIRTAVSDGSDIAARTNMAIASTMAGVAFLNGGLGVVHGIAQSMGGLHHTPHGIANALILPYAMERNCVGNLKKFRDIAIALGEDTDGLSPREAARASVEAVFDLIEDVRLPSTLGEVGVTERDFAPIIEGTMGYRLLAMNPCTLYEKDIEDILRRAAEGR
jgi:alcohol dehydrogenase class IV